MHSAAQPAEMECFQQTGMNSREIPGLVHVCLSFHPPQHTFLPSSETGTTWVAAGKED